MKTKTLFIILILCLSLFLYKCNETTTTDGDDTDSDDSSAITSALIAAFPTDLIIASPAEAIPSAIPAYLKNAAAADFADSFEAKKETLTEIFAGDEVSECTFTFSPLAGSQNATCYGPSLYYLSHPDSIAEGIINTDGNLPGGDLGIWDETEGGTEACAAAQLNMKVNNIAGLVDSIIFTMASLKCVAEANSLELPAAGSSLDLTDEVTTAYSTNSIGLTVSAVAIARESNDADGNEVYVSTIAGTFASPASASVTETMSCRLKHIPTNDDNTFYKGKISCTMSESTSSASGNCAQFATAGQTQAFSIAYEKSSATSLSYELNSGNFCGANADPYVSSTNYTVDRTKVASATDTDGWGNNFNFARFTVNPSTGAGDFHFGWQAGMGDGWTRSMNGSVTSSGTTTTGTLYFGFGPDIAGTADPATLNGMFCNWAVAGSATHDTIAATKVSRQVITQNSSGIFEVTSSNITYAPTNSCDSAGTPFCYGKTASPTFCDAVTNNLVDVSSATFATPTAPTDVDA